MTKMNAYRLELKNLLAGLEWSRPPALRRSFREDWIYASDAPALAGEETLKVLIRRAAEAGWETAVPDGWIQFRKPAPEPPEGWFPGPFGSEAACCASLLRRHPDQENEAAEAAQRRLIRAGEEGAQAYEAACEALHREWAAKLRRGEKLPAVSPAYFTEHKEAPSCC